jgi:hypothetical protein
MLFISLSDYHSIDYIMFHSLMIDMNVSLDLEISIVLEIYTVCATLILEYYLCSACFCEH